MIATGLPPTLSVKSAAVRPERRRPFRSVTNASRFTSATSCDAATLFREAAFGGPAGPGTAAAAGSSDSSADATAKAAAGSARPARISPSSSGPRRKAAGSRSSAIQQILCASRPARSASHARTRSSALESRRPSRPLARRGAAETPDLEGNEDVGEITPRVGGAKGALVARRVFVSEHDDDRAPPRDGGPDERGRRHGRREPVLCPRDGTLIDARERERAFAVIVLRGAIVALQAVHPVRDAGRAAEGAACLDSREEDDVVQVGENLPHAPSVSAEQPLRGLGEGLELRDGRGGDDEEDLSLTGLDRLDEAPAEGPEEGRIAPGRAVREYRHGAERRFDGARDAAPDEKSLRRPFPVLEDELDRDDSRLFLFRVRNRDVSRFALVHDHAVDRDRELARIDRVHVGPGERQRAGSARPRAVASHEDFRAGVRRLVHPPPRPFEDPSGAVAPHELEERDPGREPEVHDARLMDGRDGARGATVLQELRRRRRGAEIEDDRQAASRHTRHERQDPHPLRGGTHPGTEQEKNESKPVPAASHSLCIRRFPPGASVL